MTTITAPTQSELDAFLGQAVTDFGAAATVAMVLVGDRLGLYEALADGGPQSPEELATRTDTHPRLVREWLHNQAAAGYVVLDGSHDAGTSEQAHTGLHQQPTPEFPAAS
jgi:predicted transcriptional regulator